MRPVPGVGPPAFNPYPPGSGLNRGPGRQGFPLAPPGFSLPAVLALARSGGVRSSGLPSGASFRGRVPLPNPYVPPSRLGGQHDSTTRLGPPPLINQAAFARLSPQEQQLLLTYLAMGRGRRPQAVRDVFAEYRGYRDAANPQHDS